jgi:hypothetical protein
MCKSKNLEQPVHLVVRREGCEPANVEFIGAEFGNLFCIGL